MLKAVAIKDVGFKVEIPGRGFVRTPVEKMMLTDDQIRRLLNTHNGPKRLYLINPRNEAEQIILTNENYNQDVMELFGYADHTVEATDDSYTLDDVTEPEVVADAEEPAADTEDEVEVTAGEPEVTEDVETATTDDAAVDAEDSAEDDVVAVAVDPSAHTEDEVPVADVTEETVVADTVEVADEAPKYNGNNKYNTYKKNRR